MGKSQREGQRAVEAGYWPLYRYNPELALEGKNPSSLTRKSRPQASVISSWVKSGLPLQKLYPEQAEKLFVEAEKEAKLRYEMYKRMAQD